MELEIYTDGACYPNPGRMGIGIVIKKGENVIKTIAEATGKGTNNIAEYQAVIKALKEARKLKAEKIEIYSDSQLVVNQVNGSYSVKDEELKQLHAEVIRLKNDFKICNFIQIDREENRFANRLSIQAIHKKRLGIYLSVG